MKYQDYLTRDHFDQQEVLAFAHGRLLEDAPDGFNSQLPLPPMLMIDRITALRADGNRGIIHAERDVRIDDWFFQCHFLSDPVQPGCLGVDAVWQLIGFYCAWRGGLGTGRALGCGEIEFLGQIRPHDHCVRYEVDIRRHSTMPHTGVSIAVADATVFVDDQPIYRLQKAKSGLFHDIGYSDYPFRSAQSRGGILERQ